MTNLSRPEDDPFSLSTEELINRTLEKLPLMTEIEYQIGLMKRIKYTDVQLLELYAKAKSTLMIELCLMGRLGTFDKIMDLYTKYVTDT